MTSIIKSITARDLITKAAKLAQIIGSGETLEDYEAEDALEHLNEILDSWNLENMMQSFTSSTSILLNNYKLDENNQRYFEIPTINNQIQSIFYKNGMTNRMLQSLDQDVFDCSTISSSNNIDPTGYVYQGGSDEDRLTARIYLNSYIEVGKIVVKKTGQFNMFETLDDNVSLGSGYTRALKYNLAVVLATEYGRSAPDFVISKAVSDKALIKVSSQANKTTMIYNDFPGCVGRSIRYDIRNGD